MILIKNVGCTLCLPLSISHGLRTLINTDVILLNLKPVMPDGCVVPGCVPPKVVPLFPSDSSVSFHRFPVNVDVRSKWLANLGLEAIPYERALVCSKHFTASCFKKRSVKDSKLKNAILHAGEIVHISRHKCSYLLPPLHWKECTEDFEEVVHFHGSSERIVVRHTYQHIPISRVQAGDCGKVEDLWRTCLRTSCTFLTIDMK